MSLAIGRSSNAQPQATRRSDQPPTTGVYATSLCRDIRIDVGSYREEGLVGEFDEPSILADIVAATADRLYPAVDVVA